MVFQWSKVGRFSNGILKTRPKCLVLKLLTIWKPDKCIRDWLVLALAAILFLAVRKLDTKTSGFRMVGYRIPTVQWKSQWCRKFSQNMFVIVYFFSGGIQTCLQLRCWSSTNPLQRHRKRVRQSLSNRNRVRQSRSFQEMKSSLLHDGIDRKFL